MLKVKFWIIAVLIVLASCAREPEKSFELKRVSFKELPGWREDSLNEAMPALLKTCSSPIEGWENFCTGLMRVQDRSERQIRSYLEAMLVPYEVRSYGKNEGTFTGYYEASLHGSFEKCEKNKVPLYGLPEDLVRLDTRTVCEPGGDKGTVMGRIQNGKEAVDLLIEKDFQTALEKSNRINRYNETRKDLDKSMTEEANRIVDKLSDLSERRSIVIYNEAWHKGVIGIVASRLTEIYYRPAVVLTRTENLATGSARSVSGFDVYKAIEHCRDLLENFGGHTYAAGLSMKIENVPEFTRRFEEYVTNHILPEQTSATIDIDAQLDFRDITPKFFFDLKKFNPFGPDNHKPVFITQNVYDYGTSKVVGRDQEHIKLELVDNKSNNVMNGIAFGQSSQVRYIKTKQSFNICYTIEENTHKRGEIQLQIEDIKPTFK